nr:ribonuclease HII [Oxobacter pfennigii]
MAKLTIKEITTHIENSDAERRKELIEILKMDTRSAVQNLLIKLSKKEDRDRKEIERLEIMKSFEYQYIKRGARYIAGIDEVGRGPLAGPVYASAVILPIECVIKGINDSKKLSPQKRSLLYEEIKEKAVCYSTGYCDEKTIDEVNILKATFKAMKQAVEGLSIKPDVLLIDAVKIPDVDIFQVPIIKGDAKSFSIAAASIVAKVERDTVMDKYHELFPHYNFISNKGYGTQDHIDAIKKHGPCNIHRRSFIGSFV